MAERENVLYSELSENYTEIIHGDGGVPYVSPGSPALAGEHNGSGESHCRIYVFDRASQFDLLFSVPQSFMLDSPVPAEVCSRFGLVQRKCDFPDNLYRDLLIYSSGHKLTDAEIQFVNKLYETRNSVAFTEYK